MSNDKDLLPYRVGGLLYTPATRTGIVEKIEKNLYPGLTSVAFCLEDSICDDAVELAEDRLVVTLADLSKLRVSQPRTPLVFIRVRNPEHLKNFSKKMMRAQVSADGFIFPKFDVSNAAEYMKILKDMQASFENTVYCMPILESRLVASLGNRVAMLEEVRDVLNSEKDLVLNVRVGGNDLSNLYGIRRSANQVIYDIGVVRDILSNIVNVFGSEFVVSGPVWEYFGSNEIDEWAVGLKREIELDLVNGFFGKTAIHPSQLPIITKSLMVNRADYEDARSILSWRDNTLAVEKSFDGSRMNEFKCHINWARKIVMRAEIYGVNGGEGK